MIWPGTSIKEAPPSFWLEENENSWPMTRVVDGSIGGLVARKKSKSFDDGHFDEQLGKKRQKDIIRRKGKNGLDQCFWWCK
jgi:hypothetical protein